MMMRNDGQPAASMINRRKFLRYLYAGVLGVGLPLPLFAGESTYRYKQALRESETSIRDYIYKMRHFDDPHPSDVSLTPDQFDLLKSSLERMLRVQRLVGYGNFHLISFDDAIRMARGYARVGDFSKAEIDFLEQLFYSDASHYGFLGEKPVNRLTENIQRKEVIKIPGSGNYLYKGHSRGVYDTIRKSIGRDVILTSGVRSVMKQFLLFLRKAYRSRGNLSLASRSLAPPGYSYHAIGDFDVGQAGLGALNFTSRFAETDVFHRLQDLGYIRLRYARNNLLGVRFEPWHIRVRSEFRV